jgi:hypothetical protein
LVLLLNAFQYCFLSENMIQNIILLFHIRNIPTEITYWCVFWLILLWVMTYRFPLLISLSVICKNDLLHSHSTKWHCSWCGNLKHVLLKHESPPVCMHSGVKIYKHVAYGSSAVHNLLMSRVWYVYSLHDVI